MPSTRDQCPLVDTDLLQSHANSACLLLMCRACTNAHAADRNADLCSADPKQYRISPKPQHVRWKEHKHSTPILLQGVHTNENLKYIHRVVVQGKQEARGDNVKCQVVVGLFWGCTGLVLKWMP
jgi:hypothetical protein